SVMPGSYLSVERLWKKGDRIDLYIDAPLRLEAVDEQHPNLIALLQGPLALFTVGDRFLPLTRAQLLTAIQTGPGSSQWKISTSDGDQLLKPYFAIGAERTRLYHPVSA